MPKLAGLFDSFDNLDQILIEDIARWLKSPPQNISLENYLANRILYPQIIPTTELDMKIDLAILREAIRLNGPTIRKNSNAMLGENPFLNVTLRKLLIPAKFLSYVPNLVSLTWVFVDALLLNRQKMDWFSDLWTVVLVGQTDQVVGSIILPQFSNKNGLMELILDGKAFKVRSGSLMVIPCSKNRCRLAFKSSQGKILGKEHFELEIYGGDLGVMVDGRT